MTELKKSKVKLLVTDVDGTLTDGKIYCSGSGEAFKAFDVKDGYGIADILPRMGIIPAVITGRTSDIVRVRAAELGITELHMGVADKEKALGEIAEKYGCSRENIAYIGDDLNDLPCIRLCGLTACPNDAVDEVKNAVDYVCKNIGGSGAVREFIDTLRSKATQ